MSVKLSEMLPIQNLPDYKLHLACSDEKDNPLDVFVRSKAEWQGWNSYRGGRDRFNRRYIFCKNQRRR